MAPHITECSDVNNLFSEWYQGPLGGAGYKGSPQVLAQHHLVGVWQWPNTSQWDYSEQWRDVSYICSACEVSKDCFTFTYIPLIYNAKYLMIDAYFFNLISVWINATYYLITVKTVEHLYLIYIYLSIKRYFHVTTYKSKWSKLALWGAMLESTNFLSIPALKRIKKTSCFPKMFEKLNANMTTISLIFITKQANAIVSSYDIYY